MFKALSTMLPIAVSLASCSAAGGNQDGVDKNAQQVSKNQAASLQQVSANLPGQKPDHTIEGRCYMNECGFYRVKRSEVIEQRGKERLVLVSLIYGGQEFKSVNDTDQAVGKGRIKWNKPYTKYVFCSSRLPATIDGDGSDKTVNVLDFVNFPPGVLEDDASIWQDTCYPNDNWGSDGFDKRHHLAGFDETPDITIESLKDIFRASANPNAFATPQEPFVEESNSE